QPPGRVDEVGRGIVAQALQRAVLPDPRHHRIDSSSVTDIAGVMRDAPAGRLLDLLSRRLQHGSPAPADDHVGAKLGKPAAHALAEPGASASYEDSLIREKIRHEHGF